MERRRHIRRNVETSVWLYQPSDGRPSIMRSADLSLSGMRLTWLRPVMRGQPLLLRLHLGANGPAIECKGRVCWCEQLANGMYRFGVRFLDLADDETAQMEEFFSVTKAGPVLAAV